MKDAGNKTVLVVDDEANDLERIRGILQTNEQFNVWTATDYDQALQVFEKHSEEIDLALLDVALPGRNGVDLAKHLLQLKGSLRVLFISGHVGVSVIRFYGMDAADKHFLQKPFDGPTLLRRVQQALDSDELPQFVFSATNVTGGATDQ